MGIYNDVIIILKLSVIHIYTYLYIFIHIYTYLYIFIHIYTYLYIFIHIYTYLYIFIHIYTYLYIFKYSQSMKPFKSFERKKSAGARAFTVPLPAGMSVWDRPVQFQRHATINHLQGPRSKGQGPDIWTQPTWVPILWTPDLWAAFWCKNGYDSKARPSKSIGFGQPSAVLCSYNSHFTGLVQHERRVGLFCQVRTTSSYILNSPTFTSCLNPPDHLSALGGCPTTSLSLSNSSWSVSCNEEISPAMDITNKNKQEQAAYHML